MIGEAFILVLRYPHELAWRSSMAIGVLAGPLGYFTVPAVNLGG